MPSPVRHKFHGKQHSHLGFWLCAYQTGTPFVEVSDNSTVRLDPNNEPQPDCLLFIQPEHGGQTRMGEDGCIEGAPELVAEVASSSASYDLGVKLEAYRRSGVREYVVWRVLDQAVDWFVNRGDQFEPLCPALDGTLQSMVFPGLWLNSRALIGGDLNAVLASVQQGMSSSEHAAFVARLEQAHKV